MDSYGGATNNKSATIFIDRECSWLGYRESLIDKGRMCLVDDAYSWDGVEISETGNGEYTLSEFFDSCLVEPGVQVLNIGKNDSISTNVLHDFSSTFTIYHGCLRRTVVTFDSDPVVNRSILCNDCSPVKSLVDLLGSVKSWRLKQITMVNL
ncbi:17 kDa protein [Blackcurrant-associated closterovirus 1]|uniref:17 kDa protein n=1 Tax=Blackcurrant closterovirus 1 TaxID=2734344 RepID=A0A385L385_9CLOS|nr:17 kDa protein [Blackcurrant-associated closterovirus 1]AYA22230.1 17 kDa protein [Blackcurrant-associated closterovirus 1]